MPIDPNTAADAGADTNQDLPETGSPDTNLPDANLPDTNAIDTGSTCAAHGYTGVLVSFDLSSQTGSEASVPATPVAPGVTGVALTRSAAILPVSGSGSINGSNWAAGPSADATRYYTFGINAGAGCTVTLTGLTIDTVASTQGPKTVDVATSADAFATHTAASAGTSASTKTLAATASSPIEVRVYGYAAGATAGTLRIQNMMTLSGTLN